MMTRLSTIAAAAAAAATATLLLANHADGHILQRFPISRQYSYGPLFKEWDSPDIEYCPHCYNARGPKYTRERALAKTDSDLLKEYGNGEFPMYYSDRAENGNYLEPQGISVRHGVCGDPEQNSEEGTNFYSTPNSNWEVFDSFKGGDVIEIDTIMNAYHWGHCEFFICNSADLDDPEGVATQECFNKNPLTRATDDGGASPIDPDYPGRYYVDPECRGTETDQSDPYAEVEGYSIKMRYVLPNIECEHCVLQMVYYTGNSCKHVGYDEFEPESWPGQCAPNKSDWIELNRSICGENGAYPEEFWACSDISITSDGTTMPTTPTSTDDSATDASATEGSSTTTTSSGSNETTAQPMSENDDGAGLSTSTTESSTDDYDTPSGNDEQESMGNDDGDDFSTSTTESSTDDYDTSSGNDEQESMGTDDGAGLSTSATESSTDDYDTSSGNDEQESMGTDDGGDFSTSTTESSTDDYDTSSGNDEESSTEDSASTAMKGGDDYTTSESTAPTGMSTGTTTSASSSPTRDPRDCDDDGMAENPDEADSEMTALPASTSTNTTSSSSTLSTTDPSTSSSATLSTSGTSSTTMTSSMTTETTDSDVSSGGGQASSYEHLGCFMDSREDRVLGYRIASSTMTTDMCLEHCSSKAAAYMATQYGHECWCSRRGGLDYERHGVGMCDQYCEGGKDGETETCGGTDAFDLYELEWPEASTDSNYIDCYADSYQDRVMGDKLTLDDMTPALCREHCSDKNALYYGTQYSTECWCGTSDVVADYERHGQGVCHMACGGDPDVACGGYHAFSLFALMEEEGGTPAPSAAGATPFSSTTMEGATPAPSMADSTTDSTSEGCTGTPVKPWQQCGGDTWEGSTCCTEGYTCTVMGAGTCYSQCSPDASSMPDTYDY